MHDSVYDPAKEWESFEFPVEISNLQFEKNFHKIPSSCKINIWRDENFKLKAKLSGHTLTPKTLDDDKREDGPGNFAELDTITGYDSSNEYSFTLTNCVIGSYNLKGIIYKDIGMPFSADIHFDSFFKKPVTNIQSNDEDIIQYDWFVCARVSFFYSGMSRHFILDGKRHKIREGVDPKINTDEVRPISSSWDYFSITIPEIRCLVALVPKDFGVSWAQCMCIEYRSSLGLNSDRNTKKSLENFLGFLLGTELVKIGTTTFAGDKAIYQEAISPSGGDVMYVCQNGSKPPIQFNLQQEWSKIQFLVDSLLPVYFKNKDSLNLDGILWRFFQTKSLAVGVNLPILSSALELLATNYLKAHTEISLTYMGHEQYNLLIQAEVESLKTKLSGIEGNEKIVNKIKAAYKRGGNEILDLFFTSINLPTSKIEKKALQSRNSMAHGGADIKTMAEAKKLILNTRAYETLFHRVFLRILGYGEYYIDYYLSGTKSKKITVPTGPKEA
jgi:hypothetical protein